jgi:GT2 family glycosyltransferase
MANRKTRANPSTAGRTTSGARGKRPGSQSERPATSNGGQARKRAKDSAQPPRKGLPGAGDAPNSGQPEAEVGDLSGIVTQHDQALADLGEQVDSLLVRQEWIQSGLYDLNFSLTALAQADRASGAPLTDERLAYFESVRAIREVVRRVLPRDATVVVVSKGDDALVDLYGRRAWHFPQAPDERYAGYYLPDGTGLIAHLEVLRARGAQYLLFPKSALWWLESYHKFARHLQRHYPLVLSDHETCAIYALERYSATDPSAWMSRIAGLVAEYVAEVGTEPSILDWSTGLGLKNLLPDQAVFSPPMPAGELPYLDRTVDIVVTFSSDDAATGEARRVARHAVVMLEGLDHGQSAQGSHGGPERLAVRIERVAKESERKVPVSSIVIPTYDGWEQLGLCLIALEETLPDPFEGEVIVVADGSGEETQALLDDWKQSGSRLNPKVIRNESNCGFTETCNVGAAAATGDILVFLNDDTLPQLGWLSALLRTFRDNPNAGAVGGKLLYPDGSIQEAGNVVFRDGSAANYGKGDYRSDDPLYTYVREVDYCSAALLATPRALFAEIGGFDIRYRPAYYEDTDYCFAVRDHGYSVLYQPESVVIHTEGATGGTDLSSGVKKYQVVNQSKFMKKWRQKLSQQPNPPDRYDLRTWYNLAIRRAGA